MKIKSGRRVVNGSIYVVMSLVSVMMLFPFLWMLTTSLKVKMHALDFPPQWIPSPVTFEAYKNIWSMAPLVTGIANSLIIAVPILVCGTFVSALGAFAFSKMDIPHKETLFMGLLSTMMIAGSVIMIPRYVAWSALGLVDTFAPLIIPGLFGNVMMMFFFRQFLNGVPNELIDAAKIDGAGWMNTFLRVFCPILRPAMAAQVIFAFMGIWNDFMGPLIYLDSQKNYTVQLALRLLNSMSENTSEYPAIMAGSVITCLPLLLLFAFFQRYFMDSMIISGIKG